MNKQLLKKELQHCYSDQAEHFAHTRKKIWPEMQHITSYLQKHHQSSGQQIRILELGCGAGRMYPLLYDMYGKQMTYIGNDLAPGMIHQARTNYEGSIITLDRLEKSRAKKQWIIADMVDLLRSLPDNSIDVVLSIASIQHLMSDEERCLVRLHSYRVLTYTGSFISVNRSYSDWFLKTYRKDQLMSLGKSIIYPQRSRNDFTILWKDPSRKQNQHVWRRYYHLFTRYELEQMSKLSGFVIGKLGYILQDGSFSGKDRRKSRNTLLIAQKNIISPAL